MNYQRLFAFAMSLVFMLCGFGFSASLASAQDTGEDVEEKSEEKADEKDSSTLACDSIIDTSHDKVTGKTNVASKKPVIISDKEQTEGFVSFVVKGKEDSVIWVVKVIGSSPCINDTDKAYILFTDGTRLSMPNDIDFNCENTFTTYYGGVFGAEDTLAELAKKKIEILRVETQKEYVEREFSDTQAETMRRHFQCISK